MQPATILRAKLVTFLGAKCVSCNETDVEMLQIDHIHNDGSADRHRFKSNLAIYIYYLEHPIEAREKLQVMCANHNWKKRSLSMKRSSVQRKLMQAPSMLATQEEWSEFLNKCTIPELEAIIMQAQLIFDLAQVGINELTGQMSIKQFLE